MESLWRRIYQYISGQQRTHRRRVRPPAPSLKILRLERRRVLSADFSFGASGLVLHGFDTAGGETLSISQLETEYRFTLDNSSWNAPAGDLPEGVQLSGDTLSIDSNIIDQIVDSLTVIGNANSPLHVTLDQADFSFLDGPLSFTGIRSLNQSVNSLFSVSDSFAMEVNAAEAGLTIGSINVAGNIVFTSLGPIVDGDGTQINVTGNATFISRALRPAADFDADGTVTNLDYSAWAANFGLASGATNSQGDANGDGAVDITDFNIWRNSLGQVSVPGGITLADNPTDQLTVGGIATFEAQDGPSRYDINVGAMGTTHFGSLAVIGANVFVQEDSASVLVKVDASDFTLTSNGSITDAPGTPINVTGLASFDAGSNSITLGDSPADTTNFGQLQITGSAVSIVEDSSTELTGVTAASLYLKSSGPITDAAGTTIGVSGLATFDAGGNAITLGDDVADTTNFNQLHLTGGMVTVTEDSGTELTGVSATTLNLISDGPVSDAPGTTINITGLATLNAGGNPITLGDGAADTTNFGQLHLTGGAINITEDSSTEFKGITANSLQVVSAGPITDAPGTPINVTSFATLTAGGAITLADNAADVLSVGGLATFSAPTFNINVGPGGMANFGSLNLNGATVTVQEDSSTQLTGITANSLSLTSAGGITDASGTTIDVTQMATFTAGGAIVLADNVADVLSVGGLATFSAPTFNITLGPAGTANFDALHLSGAVISVQEDSASVLNHVTATSFSLTSTGSITDAPNTTISVTGLATFNAGANPITLGDNAGDSTNFGQLHLTGGTVTVTEDSGTQLTGVSATSLTLTSTGPITDADNTTISITNLATFNAGLNQITLGDHAGDSTNFGQLHLTGSAVAVTEDSATVVTGISATTLNLTSAGEITDISGTSISVVNAAAFNAGGFITLADNGTDVLMVGGLATFSAPTFNITIGPAGMANFGSLNLNGAAVSVQEDSSTLLTGVTANSLALTSAGGITDAPATTINVTTTSTMTAGGAIALADNGTDVLSVGGLATFSAPTFNINLGPAGMSNFGSLNLNGAAVTVQEDSSTLLTGVTANSLNLTSAGGISDAPATAINVTTTSTMNAGGAITLADNGSDVLSVVGLATFSAPTFNITIGPDGMANFGSLNLNGAAVSVQEDSSTLLEIVTANSLVMTSAGAITDSATISVTTTATFNAGGEITLANIAGEVLSVGGLATFSAPTFAITIGPAGMANFGSLNLNGAAVSVQEDSSTLLTGISANSLALTSAGAITDAPATTINVTTTSTMNAGGAITLADNGTDSLSVGGLATFSAPTFNISIGPAGMANFGSVNLNGAIVSVQEDSSTLLTGVSANSLTLTSAGSITDAPDTTISVVGLATLNAGANDITLGDNPGDTTNFGSLNLTGKDIAVQEDSATELTGVTAASLDSSLDLNSAGAITDSSTAVIFVNGPGTFLADGNITLADMGAANSLIVVQLGSFEVTDGHNIDVGVIPASGLPAAANAQLGSLQFTAQALLGVGGQVRVALDGPVILSGGGSGSTAEDAELTTTPESSGGGVEMNNLIAGTLSVQSDGPITDAPLSDVQIAGLSAMTAKGEITLANEGPNNRFTVGGHARFTSSLSNAINLGIDTLAPARGTAASALITLGSFSFVTDALDGSGNATANGDEGDFTANLDNAVVLADMSLAGTAWIQSAGSLSDAPGANTTVTKFAVLQAADSFDIVLGDDAARFSMDTQAPTLQVFDASRYLALHAENVSIEADSGFNLSTNAEFNQFPGTVFLSAAGNITQVSHEGDMEPLEANRIAMLGAAAILFSQVRVNSQVTTDAATPANLAIHGGSSLPISVLPPNQFPTDLIPSSTITSLSPVAINPAGTAEGRADGSGLTELVGAQILNPTPIGDGYSIIMKVLGDAKLGIVQDATGAQSDLVGVSVNSTGNVFLQTVADDGVGSGQMVPSPALPEVGNIVFTSRGANTEVVVDMAGGVFTAIAAGKLTIDTAQPGSATGAVTTILRSTSGTVTSVESYSTYDGRALGPSMIATKIGPRLILDAPTEEANAATTGLVLSPGFEQRLTIVAGSRGENNLIVELVWADVLSPPDVPGSRAFPDVALVPINPVEDQALQPGLELSDPSLNFRVVTVRHEYAGEFIPDNPALPKLPTTIRLYNDPAINLYDHNSQGEIQNLNVVDNFVQPRVIAVPTAGYFQLASIELPAVYDAPDQILTTVVSTVPQDRVVLDEIRVASSTDIDVIRYGRVDENGEFIEEEGWPLTWEQGREGDFLNEIREAVDNSTALEGQYRIEAATTRGNQSLEEWVKGDEAVENQADGAAIEAGEESDSEATGEDGTDPIDTPDASSMFSPLESEQPRAPIALRSTSLQDEHLGDETLAGGMLIGASMMVTNRVAPREEPISTRTPDRVDFSRAARRRRALRRLELVPSGT